MSEEKVCYFCGKSLRNKVTFSNLGTDPETGEPAHSWIHMPIGKSSDFECYIKKCIEEFMKK